jgi:hypothetical protein
MRTGRGFRPESRGAAHVAVDYTRNTTQAVVPVWTLATQEAEAPIWPAVSR